MACSGGGGIWRSRCICCLLLLRLDALGESLEDERSSSRGERGDDWEERGSDFRSIVTAVHSYSFPYTIERVGNSNLEK